MDGGECEEEERAVTVSPVVAGHLSAHTFD